MCKNGCVHIPASRFSTTMYSSAPLLLWSCIPRSRSLARCLVLVRSFFFFWSVFYSMNGTVGRNEQSIVWHYLVVLRIGHKLCLWKCRGMLQLLEWGRKLGRVLVRVLSQLWPTQLGCRDGLKCILTSAMLKSTYFSLSECFHIFFFSTSADSHPTIFSVGRQLVTAITFYPTLLFSVFSMQ